MRITFEARLRSGNAHLSQRIPAAIQCLFPGDRRIMAGNGFQHLRINAQYRIQGHQRVLKNHGDAGTAQLAQAARICPHQFLAEKAYAAAHDAARRVHQPENGKTGHGLAGPGLAHKPHDLAPGHGKTNSVHGPGDARPGEKMSLQITDVKQSLALPAAFRHMDFGYGHCWSLGFRISRRWSPTRLMPTMSSSRAMPG